MKMKTTAQFIYEAVQIHGDIYDYSKVNYCGVNVNVIIICKLHGEFSQQPNNHLNGFGCSKCSNKFRLGNDLFIQRAKEIHGDVYDYSKVIYGKSNKHKVIIGCKIHGDFLQTPNKHLNGNGCSMCFGNKLSTTEEFIYKSNNVHKHKYIYNKSEYKHSKYKITITCNNHGDFEQNPTDHLSGQGCPKCKLSRGELKISDVLLRYNIPYIRQYTFVNCRNIKPLPFDFYIPSLNICIEFDGIQHIYGWKSDKESLKSIQHNDNIKTKYCYTHNINLIRIPHSDISNIENIIINEIINKRTNI